MPENVRGSGLHVRDVRGRAGGLVRDGGRRFRRGQRHQFPFGLQEFVQCFDQPY